MKVGGAFICFAVGALFLAACGGSEELAQGDALKVATAEAAFSSTVVNSSRYGETLDGVDDLIMICREDPEAIYKTTVGGVEERTMRQVVEDGANTLREYRPDLAAELEQVADNQCE
jgi:hypothetical protein